MSNLQQRAELLKGCEVIHIHERNTILVFFIGRELYWRFLEGYNSPQIQKNARLAMKHFLTHGIDSAQ